MVLLKHSLRQIHNFCLESPIKSVYNYSLNSEKAMNLVKYFVNVAVAATMTFLFSWIISEPVSSNMFAGALLGAFFADYLKMNK